MELNEKQSIKDEDIDGDLLGRKINLPNCANCVYSEGKYCKKYNADKNDLEEKGIDIFDCPSFEPKQNDSEIIKKIKTMGFEE